MMEGSGQCPDEAKGMRIVQVADLTGKGIPEALVEYCHMGAYTSDLTLMRIENGKPVEVRFRDAHRKIASVGFLEGASVKNGEDTKLLPEKHAVYAIHWHTDDSGALAACTVDAYVWSPKTETFDLNHKVARLVAQRECATLQKPNSMPKRIFLITRISHDLAIPGEDKSVRATYSLLP